MWQKLRSLELSDWLVIGQSAVLLPALRIALRRARVDRVQARLLAWSGGMLTEGASHHDAARAVTRMVDAVGKRLPFDINCLHRTLAAWFLLRRRGIGSTIRFGVKPEKPPAFHAWIEIEGVVINDRPDVASIYLPFPSAIEPSQLDRFD